MSSTTTHIETMPPRDHRGGKMLAGVYRGKGSVICEEVPIPEIGEGEILFRVAACGICGTDIKKIAHGFVPAPQIFGHELAGTVVEVGRGVRKFKPGDRIVSFHHVPCGRCFYCERKLFSQCPEYKKVGLTAGFTPNGGGFAQFVRAMPWIVERGMLAIPPGITFEEATFIEPVNTAAKAVWKGRVAKGEFAVVLGQGPIGMLLTGLSKLKGAEVVTTDPLAGRRAASLRLGATASFDPASEDLRAKVRERTHGRGADVVLLAAPHPKLVSEALDVARPGGRVVLFAHNDPVLKIEFPAAAVGIEEKEILGSYSASITEQEEYARIVFERRLPLAQLVSNRFPTERIAEALQLAAHPADSTLKVVISHS
ncbi:MAG TPA: alcohol dehydrogenase catalytic domain-containing protein [Candidatus Acidoferrales bacterium]|nr:alcohol dehydrogenase catalytic domain-containing protein [Candidatus Acidoferrales bacterium]